MEIRPEPKRFELGIKVPDGQSVQYWEGIAMNLAGKINSLEIMFEAVDGLNVFPPKTVLCEGFYSGKDTPFDFIMIYSFAQTWCFLCDLIDGSIAYVDAFETKDHRSVFSIGESIECQEDDE